VSHGRISAGVWIGAVIVVVAALAPLRAQDADSVYAVLLQGWREQEKIVSPETRTSPQVAPPFESLIPEHRVRRRPAHSAGPQTIREKKREPKIETVKPGPVEKMRQPPKPAQIPANPHLALMTDPTLIPGDIVIFPDGPRVFQGTPGERHSPRDFVPFRKAKGLAKADRKYLMALRTGVNTAWAEAAIDTKVARKARDVESTGSVSKAGPKR
jgi:hypothetical protein